MKHKLNEVCLYVHAVCVCMYMLYLCLYVQYMMQGVLVLHICLNETSHSYEGD